MSGIGIVLDSFGQPVKEALRSASQLAFRQVELPVTSPEVDPVELSRSGRRDLLHHVRGLGLQMSALGGDLGGGRFNDSSAIERRLDKTRRIIEMAAEMRVPVVTSHLGLVTEESLRKGYVREVLRNLADIADRTGTFVALETGAADPQLLANLLKEVGSQQLGACYDPASLLIDGFDPLSGVEPLADRILVARARDAVAGTGQNPGRETPLGQGQVDFAEYLAALDQAGHRSAPFIRRTQSPAPLQEIADAKARLDALLGR